MDYHFNMKYNTATYDGVKLLDFEIKKAKEKNAIVNFSIEKNTRTNAQNSARWLYIKMLVIHLDELGMTFNVTDKLESKFTKDLIYHVYWQPLRKAMFKSKRQLNTKEFCELADMFVLMCSKHFDFNEPFPSLENMPTK